MVPQAKPRIAIVTIHPLNYGGVLTILKVVYNFCLKFFEPTLFFPSFDPSLSQSIRSPFTKANIRKTEYFGMPSIEIGTRFAFWEPGHYQFTQYLWKEALEEYDYFFVVSGTVISAHPVALLKKKYVLWGSTLYQDDRAVRKKSFSLIRKIIDRAAQPSMKKIERKILLQAAEIGAQSFYGQRTFQEIRNRQFPKIRHIGIPVKPAETVPFKSASKEKVIIAVGRFNDPRKNGPMLFAAFEKIYASYPHVELIIVGNKPDVTLINAYKEKPCFDNIKITGHISDEELISWYKKADLMLITSYQEGLGIIGLEAMAYGIPVVSTDCGGPSDFVHPNKNGFIVPINDSSAMANAALHIITDDVLQETMRLNAYEYIKTSASHKRTEQLFQRMLSDAYPELVNLFIQEKQE
ncbi:glycosyltransferase family 4 protein [Candidatus Babeliales bacterium]|nr:glycosyltransferase family 4 protein [Candidatus Babeliales bacterium]